MNISNKYFLVGAIVFCFLLLLVVLPPTIYYFQNPLPRGVQGNFCINNLRQLDAAKKEWALENGKTNGVVVTENDLKPYVKLDSKGKYFRCPQGGKYTIGKVGEPPTCSLGTTVTPAHVLP